MRVLEPPCPLDLAPGIGGPQLSFVDIRERTQWPSGTSRGSGLFVHETGARPLLGAGRIGASSNALARWSWPVPNVGSPSVTMLGDGDVEPPAVVGRVHLERG
jgi:hypothetical protein